MFLVIRCPGCRTFTYVDRFQQWKLCAVCGEVINVRRAPAYVEVDDYHTAESIVDQLEKYLHQARRDDLTPEEIATLREQYTQWVRNRV
ncbi:MAG TPA: DUF1922 domain-containing protein [Methanolinea sp.]|nr:DUF1922 domain-containing protein [Methanolinea sp.]